jgi:WD40 repeat protein
MLPNPKQLSCDELPLRDYLDELLSDAQQAAVEEHLDHCSFCRERIGQSAAADEWWSSAERYLGRDEWDGELALARSLSCDEPHRSAFADDHALLHQVKQWLDPTDDPRMIGRFAGYDIVGIVGHGGMGIVLKGLEASLNRYVAIKVLSPALASSGSARQRFAREAQAAAAVLHNNVVAIHRVDGWQGVPFLVMPYLSDVPLQKRIDDEGPLPLAAILRVGEQVAAGLSAAHAHGLVHRDVKPANILIGGGVERVTITDFGLARAADDASLTKTGVIAGTPQFMSPEQARGDSVDQRSDLFSLGSVMYTMSTGRPPFRAETSYGILRRITDEEPRPLREINPDIPEWLCTIIAKLMSKQPNDRFESATEVAELLEECLAHVQQPTAAPLPESCLSLRESSATFAERKAAMFRRTPLFKILTGAALACVLAFAGIAIILELNKGTLTIECDADSAPVRITQGDRVVKKLTVTRSGAWVRVAAGQYIVEIEGEPDGIVVKDGSVTLQRGGRQLVRIVMEASRPRAGVDDDAQAATGSPELEELSPELTQAMQRLNEAKAKLVYTQRLFERGYVTQLVVDGKKLKVRQAEAEIEAVRAPPKGSAKEDKAIDSRVALAVRLGTGRLRHGGAIAAAVFSPDGKRLYSVGADRSIRVWNAADGEPLRQIKTNFLNPSSIDISPDGKTLACAGWGRPDDDPVQEIVDQLEPAIELRDQWSSIELYDTERGERVKTMTFARSIRQVRFSPDGKTLAAWGGTSSTRDGKVVKSVGVSLLLDPATRRIIHELDGHDGFVADAVFSPDGSTLYATGLDNQLVYWDVVRGEGKSLKLSTLAESQRWLPWDSHLPLAISADGKTLAVGLPEMTVRLINTSDPAGRKSSPILPGRLTLPIQTEEPINALAFSSDGILIGGRKSLKHVDFATGNTTPILAGRLMHIRSLALWREQLAVVDYQVGPLHRWDLTENQQVAAGDGHNRPITSIASPPDRRFVATAAEDGIIVWEPAEGDWIGGAARSRRWLKTKGALQVSLSPDGTKLAASYWNAVVRVWDIESGRVVAQTKRERGELPISTEFAADGKTIVTVTDRGRVQSRDAESGELTANWNLPHDVREFCLAPNGQTLAIATGSKSVSIDLWSLVDRKQIGELSPPASQPFGRVHRVRFSPDGKSLLVASESTYCIAGPFGAQAATSTATAIRTFDAATGLQLRSFERPPVEVVAAGLEKREIHDAVYLAGGELIATAENDGTVLIYNVERGEIANRVSAHSGQATALAATPFGRTLISGGEDGTAAVWNVTK